MVCWPAIAVKRVTQALRSIPYRWRLSGSFLAHLFKAAAQQHHRVLLPTIERLLPSSAVVFDVGLTPDNTPSCSRALPPTGRVCAFEPSSYARSILRMVVWLRRLGNVEVLPMALGATPGSTL
jgi:hypothetical protein